MRDWKHANASYDDKGRYEIEKASGSAEADGDAEFEDS